jgi:PTH1 family peptidyl-tRNA hydrolase
MNIIVGLGNPGLKFNNTRHNVGFMAIDKFAGENSFPKFSLDKKANALVSENNETILVKPETFMNDSGKAIKTITKNKDVKNLVVIHDDIDLPVGKIKIVKERGSAGHKGVESIIKNIGNDGLIRIRVGIEGKKGVKAMKVVLKKFSPEEQTLIDQAIENTTQALASLLEHGLEKTMNEHNK